MFVARGHNFLPESWKKSRKVENEHKSWKRLRSRPPPTLKVLKLQSQIEGPSRTIFTKIHENSRKIKKIQENPSKSKKRDLKKSLKSVGKMYVCRPGAQFPPRKLEKEQKSWKKSRKVGKVEEPAAPDAKGTEAAVSNGRALAHHFYENSWKFKKTQEDPRKSKKIQEKVPQNH